MNIYLALLLFSFIILLYWVITELFTFFFRLTGLPAEKAIVSGPAVLSISLIADGFMPAILSDIRTIAFPPCGHYRPVFGILYHRPGDLKIANITFFDGFPPPSSLTSGGFCYKLMM